MIDISTEDLIDLREAARERVFRQTKTGKPAHVSSIYRFVMRGARAANGQRVKLETVRTPTGLRTSREAVARFIQALTDPEHTVPEPRSATRRRAIQQAEDDLAAAGFALQK